MRDVIGFQWRRLLPDIGWGLIWSLVLGALLMAGVFATLLIWFGEIGADTFETTFVGNADFFFSLPPWLAILSAVIWPPFRAVARSGVLTGEPSSARGDSIDQHSSF